jgi:hypothetical protein
MRTRVSHLETVELVMSDRAHRYEEEVGPRRAEVSHLTSQRAVQDQELARCLRLVVSMKVAANKKDAYIKCVLRTRAASTFTLSAVPTRVYKCDRMRLDALPLARAVR